MDKLTDNAGATAAAGAPAGPTTLAQGLALLLQAALPPDAPADLREVLRRSFMSGAWLSYQIQQLACRRALANRPDDAAQLAQGLLLELQAFDLEARLAQCATAAGQVH